MTEVFVPTWNSQRTIERCLESILEAIPEAEIFIIDKHSTDKTTQIASSYGASTRLSYGNLGQTRQLICKLATKHWFVMIDSDVYMCKDWYKNMMKFKDEIDDDKLGAIQGLSIPIYEPHRSWWILQDKQLSFPVKNGQRLLSNNVLFRREAVEGFKCDLPVFEDYVLGKYMERRGYNWYLINKARAEHDNPDIWRNAKWFGAGAVYTKYTSWWKFGVGMILKGLIETPSPWKLFRMKYYWNCFLGGLNYRKYMYFKR